MATQRFEMLSLVVSAKSQGALDAKGCLAEQGLDLRAKYPWVTRAAGLAARLKPSRRVNLLSIEITADEAAGEVRCQARGPLSRFMRRHLDWLEERVNGLGRPICLREQGFVYNLYQPPVPSARMVNYLARLAVHGRMPVRPTTCTLQVTSRCQLNCFHCSAARYKSREREELTTEEWVSVVRQAEELGCFNIVFTGGEPLLRPDIYDLIGSVRRERAQAMMFTNGLLLTEERVGKLVEAGLYSVMVSLDDPRPEKHEELRGVPGGFAKSLEGIRRALEAGILVGISTYATPEDLRAGRVEEMIELAREVGAHELTVFDVVPTGKLLPLEQEQLLTAEDKQRLIALEREYNQREGYPHIITQALVNGPEGAGCFAGFTQFYMTAFGDVDPCDFTPLTFGNIRDEDLETIWNRMLAHPAYQEKCMHCRMQDPEFRAKYIDDIPEEVLLPWPAVEELHEQPHCPARCRPTASGPQVGVHGKMH